MTEDRKFTIIACIIIGIVVQIIGGVMGYIGELPGSTKYNVYFDRLPSIVKENYTNKNFSGAFLEASSKDAASMIITADSEYSYDTNLYDEAVIGYSPIVAVFPSFYTKNKDMDNSNFSVQGNSNDYWYMTNMKDILELLIASSDDTIDLSQLGFEDTKKGSIKLAIPDKMYSYREDVIKSIAYILNDGKDLSTLGTAEMEALNSNVDKIIKKSETIKNVSSVLKTAASDNTNILLVPEYELVNSSSILRPIYWNNQYTMKVRLIYLKDGSTIDTDYDAYVKIIIDSQMTGDSFTGSKLRNNREVSNRNSTHRYANTIDMKFSEDDIWDRLSRRYKG